MDRDTISSSEHVPLPSPDVRMALANLMYLIEEIGEPGVPAATLALRSGLEEQRGRKVVDELLSLDLVTNSEHGLTRTPTPAWFPGPEVFEPLVFADALDDEVALDLPAGWEPGVEVLTDPDYAHDLPERLAMLLVAFILHRTGRTVTPRALGEGLGQRAVDSRALLDLIRLGLLPEQPHLVAELAEYQARRRVEDVEDKAPIMIVGG